MRVRVTYEVSDIERRAIRWHHGESGLATRREVVGFYESLLDGDMANVIDAFEASSPNEAEKLRLRYAARGKAVRP